MNQVGSLSRQLGVDASLHELEGVTGRWRENGRHACPLAAYGHAGDTGHLMFDRIKDHLFLGRVVAWVESPILAAVIDKQHATDCVGAFVMVLRYESKNGKIPKKLLTSMRVARFTPSEAGVALIDGVVTSLIVLEKTKGATAEMPRIMAGLELTIDSAMSATPGRVVPRNGDFGRGADASGLSEFTRDLEIPS